MKTYAEMLAAFRTEFHAFPMKYAFSDEQFVVAMRELGLDVTETEKVFAWRAVGGYYRRIDDPVLQSMLERHTREIAEAIIADPTGEDFIFSMFAYELANHEYNYTGDLSDTLEALGLTLDEVNESPRLSRGLMLAIAAQ